MNHNYDLFVIGAGSGGIRASRIAAGLGARVAVAEDKYLGGTCVNVGCVPKKFFVLGSHCADQFTNAAGYGWTVGNPRFDWRTLTTNVANEINRLNGVYDNILATAGVELIRGRATLVDAHTVKVGDNTYTAERILIAVGGWPVIPDIPGSEHIISSNEVFSLDKFPQRVIVVGGGYIAVEFAGIFNNLGSETHLLYRGDLFLRGFDRDIREFTAEEMAKKGVKLNFNASIIGIDQHSDGSLSATLADGRTLTTDVIMYAIGRKPDTANLGLENTRVQLDDNGAVVVNDDFSTHEPSVYAIGDVIDRVQLTPVALAEGMALARNLYGGQNRRVNYEFIPTAVFSQPNIATVGYNEEQAKEKYSSIAVYKSTFIPMKHKLGGLDERNLMKLIVDRATDRVVGAHMAAHDAGELIQGVSIAINAGATKADFDATIGIHPTVAEEFVTMREPSYIL